MVQSEQRKKALVIAVSEYDENSSLNKLPFCKKDGDEMLALLKGLGYEIKNQDGLIGQVDGTLMQDCIYEFFKDDDIKSDDTILFYFSGHGVPGEGDFFLASSNIDPRKPKMRGFSFADLNGEITHCRAKRTVVILDSCYAGSLDISGKSSESALASAAKNQLSTTFKEGEGNCLLSSCMGFQESFATAEGDHSFFTNYLLKGLRGAEGKSVDENGIVTPESLMSYIDREIDNMKEKVQTPFRKIESAGKIMLAAHPELASATNAKLISEKRTKIRKMLADLLSNGTISQRILTKALDVSNLDPLQVSGIEKQQWDLIEHLLQNEIDVGEFSESWLKLEWERPQKPTQSEIQIVEKKENKLDSSTLEKFIAQGDHCISKKDYEGAIKWYDKVLEIEPVNVYVIRSKGGALVELGRYEEALKLYDEGLKLVPNDKQGHTWLLNYKQEALEKQEASKSERKTIVHDRPDPKWMPPLGDYMDKLQQPPDFTPSGVWDIHFVDKSNKIETSLRINFGESKKITAKGYQLINSQKTSSMFLITYWSYDDNDQNLVINGSIVNDSGVHYFSWHLKLLGKIKNEENYAKSAGGWDVFIKKASVGEEKT